MIENIQHSWIDIMISFDGSEFLTITIPRTDMTNFIAAWKNGDIWEQKHFKAPTVNNIFNDVVYIANSTEYLRLSEVKRVIIKQKGGTNDL